MDIIEMDEHVSKEVTTIGPEVTLMEGTLES
jgi:hypothetical protein